VDDKALYLIYPESEKGETGAVALLALGIMEVLRADTGIEDSKRRQLEKYLDGYIRFVRSMVKEEGDIYRYYDNRGGGPLGAPPSPYSDGETFLALVNAVKYAGYTEFEDTARNVSEVLYRMYITMPFSVSKKNKYASAFFTWMSLAYLELYTMAPEDNAELAQRVIKLAYWIMDDQNIIRSTMNSSYVQQGLIAAWEISRLTGDRGAQSKLGYTIDRSLYKFTSWQVGSRIQNIFLSESKAADEMSLGGVLTKDGDPLLRLNIAGYQMDALIMALTFIYK
jgi:hypothetical protein